MEKGRQLATRWRKRVLFIFLALGLGGVTPPGAAQSVETDAPAEAQQTRSEERASRRAQKSKHAEDAPTPQQSNRQKEIARDLLSEDVSTPKTTWQSQLALSLDSFGVGPLWRAVGVNHPLLQLVLSLLTPLLLLALLRMAYMRMQEKARINAARKLQAEQEKRRSRNPETRREPSMRAPGPESRSMGGNTRTGPHTRTGPETRTGPLSRIAEQAPEASQRHTTRSNTAMMRPTQYTAYANTNFSNEGGNRYENTQAALRQDLPSTPAERAHMASQAANAAARAAVTVNKYGEDFGVLPPNFNVAGFVRKARIYFIRLQIAWDRSDIQNIAEITSPEICAEFQRQIAARGPSENQTDVLAFEAEVLGLKQESQKFVVTVKMTGIIKESSNPQQEAFEELWRLSRSVHGRENWLLTDIRQY
ncbi:Tim44-like domain-containing protein [Massilia sp. W12]|uniref:Tim44 domain-containing protein n=1 Tax=Massilia sp. W12 TaxID=3126507 RepID=UPI0030CE4E5C